MEALVRISGRFALVRYVADLSRGEARNVGVILVADDGFRGMRALPPSALAKGLREQGILDRVLSSMAEAVGRLDGDLTALDRWHNGWSYSLQLAEPKAAAIHGKPRDTLEALYRAFVATRPARSSRLGKAQVLDRVVSSFRNRGAAVRRSEYIDDYLFDAIVEPVGAPAAAIAALSFATGAQDWTNVERDAGHFLFAVKRVDVGRACVIQPPDARAPSAADRSYDRIRRWCDAESVHTVGLSEVDSLAASIVPAGTRDTLLPLFGDPLAS